MDDWTVSVPVAEIDIVWERAEPFIARALRRADERFSLDLVKEWLDFSKAKLFVRGGPIGESGYPIHVNAALVATVHERSWGLSMLMLAFGAESMAHALPALPAVEAYAIQRGYRTIELRAVEGRRGWLRALRGYGYRHVGDDDDGDAILIKEL